MLNVLIVENNVIQTQKLINFLSQTIPELRIYSICYTGKTAIKIISTKKPNLILLNLDLPDISGLDIINYIKENNLNNYKNSIIAISENTDIADNTYIYSCLHKPINLNLLRKTLLQFINKDNFHNLLNTKIKDELFKLNYNFSHVGTQYLIECIHLIYDKKLSRYNLSKDIYPIIAEKYNTKINTVKCDIVQATINSYCECDEEILSKYFHLFPISRPKTKYIISIILSHLEKEIS